MPGEMERLKRRRQAEVEHRLRVEAQERSTRGSVDWDRAGRELAGIGGQTLGLPVGVLRSAYDTLDGLAHTAVWAGSMVDPAARRAAGRQASNLRAAMGNYVDSRRADRSLILADLRRVGADWNSKLNPDATPMAPTAADEFKRRFSIGMNQGGAATDVVALASGAAEAKLAANMSRLSKLKEADYLRRGYPAGVAKDLVEPYLGRGHHGIVSEAMAKKSNSPTLRAFADSSFNVRRPQAVPKGAFYPAHVGIDPHYGGGLLPKRNGGGGWSAKKLGWQKYHPLEQILLGPTPKAKIAGYLGLAGLGALQEEYAPWFQDR